MKKVLSVLILATLSCIGCRREDIREVTVELPEITSADTQKVTLALTRYSGIAKNSLKWDLNKKTLSLKYDSMQIAQTNIRMAIEETGVKVVYPKNTTGRAGY